MSRRLLSTVALALWAAYLLLPVYALVVSILFFDLGGDTTAPTAPAPPEPVEAPQPPDAPQPPAA